MNYLRMSLVGDCKQLVHHASCMSVPQTTGKPVGTRGCCSPLTFPQPHLKTRVATEVGSGLHFGLHSSNWCPPREANTCDVQMMLICDNGHMQHLTVLSKQGALGHQPKGADSPVEPVLVDW